jgi:hypothetical protein
MTSMLSNLVPLVITFCSGGLAGYLFREQISRMRHRRALRHRYNLD